MSRATGYQGYRSYSYLEAGTDYEAFELSPEQNRVPVYQGLSLTTEQAQRVERLLVDEIIISLHDHPVVKPRNPADFAAFARAGRDHTGYEGLALSGLTAVFDNFMDGIATITSASAWKWTDVIADIGMRYCDIAHQNLVVRADTVHDIRDAHKNGQVALISGLEASTMIENELDRIEILYGLGIRQMGIAYSEGNSLGAGLRERRDGGLTAFGTRAVIRMNKIGMAIDISHAGDVTSMDTILQSTRPVLITHAGARGVWNSNRMKPDQVITACVERGGVIGIEAAPHTTLSASHPRHSLNSVMDHFKYLVDLVGIEHVTFGPDTLWGDHVAIHHIYSTAMNIERRSKEPEYEEVEYVDGLENPSECFRNIIGWLVAHSYSDDEIRAVIGLNTLRALELIWV